MIQEKEMLIIQIMQLSYLVQAKTKYCVFINFAGHVDTLQVDIRESKKHWEKEVLKTEFHTVYKNYQPHEDALAFYKAKRDILVRILEDGDIPYEDCEVEQEIVEHIIF